MSPSDTPTPDAVFVDPAWQVWAAENIVGGASAAEVIDALEGEGVPGPLASALVQEIEASPLTSFARTLLPRAEAPEQILRMERERLAAFEILRIPTPSADVYHNELRPSHRPFVLEGFLRESPAVAKWSFSWFAERFAGVPMKYVDSSGAKARSVESTMDAFIELICESDDAHHYYSVARNFVLREEPFSSLYDDFVLPPGFVSEVHHRKASQMWLGPAGTLTPLHFDTSDVVFSMVSGAKRVQLVPPCELGTWGLHENHMLHEEEFAEFERDGGLIFETVVRAPDALLIPVGWMHRVLALEPSITMSINGFEDNNVKWYTPGAIDLSATARD